jgi:hypothetical protein
MRVREIQLSCLLLFTYQDGLRANPGEQSGIRFNVQWKSSVRGKPLTLKLELIGSDAWQSEPLVLERPVIRRGIFSQWSTITLRGSDFNKIGNVMAWRSSLWDGESMIAAHQSFLWQDAGSAPQTEPAPTE